MRRPLAWFLAALGAAGCASGSIAGGGGGEDGGGEDAGQRRDVRLVGDPDVHTLASFGDDCEYGRDCRSGRCVRSADRKVCTRGCADELDCPPGWLCVPEVGVDVQYLCFPDEDSLCRPCQRNQDCKGQGARCLGIGGGSYCGRQCNAENRPCPSGFACTDILDAVSGEVIDHQCRPNDSRCGECVDGDGDGYGVGEECQGSDCDDGDPNVYSGAPERCNGIDDDCDHQVDEEAVDGGECGCGEPPPEECNDVDDDCDGETDEGSDGGRLTRDCGTACGPGDETCLGGQWFNCTATRPMPEVCGDGLDNDCDGVEERRPDQYEPNNDCASARSLGDDPDTIIRPTIDGVHDTNDFFKFHGDDGSSPFSKEHVEIDVQNVPAGVRLNLSWYKSQGDCEHGRAMDGVQACNGNPCVRWEESQCLAGCDDTSDYWIQVERVEGFDCGQTYELRVSGLR